MRGMNLQLPPQLAVDALHQGGVLTLRQTIEAGLDRETRRDLVRAGALRVLRQDFFTPGEYWDGCDERERHRIEIAGALMACRWHPQQGRPLLVGGRRSAGFLHGLPLPRGKWDREQSHAASTEELPPWERRPWQIDLISADREHRAYRAGVEVRPASLPESHIEIHGVVPISNLARTAVDLMRAGTRPEAVMVADATLRSGVERAELEAIAQHCHRWPNALNARYAIAFADPLAESPAESFARVALADAGIFPELQVELFDASGKIGRVDLLLRAFRVALEVDGLIKYTDPWCGSLQEALEAQEERERRLREAGWTVIRTTWQELVYEPEMFVARVRAAIAASPAVA
jgi:hypothetical protein